MNRFGGFAQRKPNTLDGLSQSHSRPLIPYMGQEPNRTPSEHPMHLPQDGILLVLTFSPTAASLAAVTPHLQLVVPALAGAAPRRAPTGPPPHVDVGLLEKDIGPHSLRRKRKGHVWGGAVFPREAIKRPPFCRFPPILRLPPCGKNHVIVGFFPAVGRFGSLPASVRFFPPGATVTKAEPAGDLNDSRLPICGCRSSKKGWFEGLRV